MILFPQRHHHLGFPQAPSHLATMGLEKFNPFKKDRQNFPGVVIPLSEAPIYPNGVYPNAAQSVDKKDDADANKSLERAPSSENGSAGSLPDTSHLTIEILRAEIEAEMSTSGHDSVYDRMSSGPNLLALPKRLPSSSCDLRDSVRLIIVWSQI